MTVTLHHGDCLQILPTLTGVDAVVSDPPYGMGWDTNSTRFSGGDSGEARYLTQGRSDHGDIEADDKPFDPAVWLAYKKLILWGANHYASRLPVGTTLVWIKKDEHLFGTFLSDAEVGWMKGGYGVYCFHKNFPPPSRIKEGGVYGRCLHPTQKPVALMKWCIERLNLPAGSTILDPYMGSGSTGVAAVELGYNFVGIETNAAYFGDASRRIRAAERQPRMAFLDVRPEPRLPQPSLFDAEVCDGGGP